MASTWPPAKAQFQTARFPPHTPKQRLYPKGIESTLTIERGADAASAGLPAVCPGCLHSPLGLFSEMRLGNAVAEVLACTSGNEPGKRVTTRSDEGSICPNVTQVRTHWRRLVSRKCLEAKVTSSTDCTRRTVEELVTFATIPPHQRSPAMAPARVLQLDHLRVLS